MKYPREKLTSIYLGVKVPEKLIKEMDKIFPLSSHSEVIRVAIETYLEMSKGDKK